MSEDDARQSAATPRLARGQLVQRKKTGTYWHVVNRYREVDSAEVSYRIANPTHTQDLRRKEIDVHVDFENTGIRLPIGVKPAGVFGHRVDGILRGKNEVVADA